jgi:polysaccharide chain length determinant protein (PEP-CTERM system associated)
MSVEFRQRKPAELARMVWRRKWLILLPTAAVAVGVAYGVYKLPNVYQSRTLLTVRPASISTNVVPQLSDSELTIRINNITQAVTSRSTLEPIIERWGLYAAERARGVSMDELVERMRTRDIEITLNTSRDITNGFFLSFRGPEPGTTQQVAAKLAEQYVNAQAESASQDAKLTSEFFNEKLDDAKKQLDEIDKHRLEFMEGHIQSLPSQMQALVGQLAGLREEQKARMAEVGRINDQIAYNNKLAADLSKSNQTEIDQAIANITDPKSTPAYAELIKRKAELESEYQTILLTFRPAAPEAKAVKKQIDIVQAQMDEMIEDNKRKVEEQRKLLEARAGADPRVASYKSENTRLQGEVERQKVQLAQTEAQIASVTQQISGLPTSEVGLEAINRDYLTAKAVYDKLVEQQHNAEINSDVAKRQQGESIAVIDPASLPEQPVAPKRPLLMLLGLLAGLACGVVLAAAAEFPRLLTIQTTEDAEHYTGLPVLVALPVLMTAREERSLRARRLALAAVSVAATILSAPALYFVLSRLHLIEMIANRG